MTAKHFKNTFSYKLVFLAAAIAIAIIAAFSICATSEARAETNEINGSLIVTYDFEGTIILAEGLSFKDEEFVDQFALEKNQDYINKWPRKDLLTNVKYYSSKLGSKILIDLFVPGEEDD